MTQILYLLLAAGLIGVDQLTKWWAATVLQKASPLSVIPGVFELSYCENDGIAFSLLEGQRWLFIPLTLIVAGLMVWILLRSPLRKRWIFSLCCAMILAGGVGNLIDRIAYGYVIDFLEFDFVNFAIFNVADACICIGAGVAALSILMDEIRTKGRNAQKGNGNAE